MQLNPLGTAYDILFYKHCGVPRDVLIVILGLSGLSLSETSMADNAVDACRQVSYICLRGEKKLQPLAVLLLTRLEGERENADPKWLRDFQEYGLHTWALGSEIDIASTLSTSRQRWKG